MRPERQLGLPKAFMCCSNIVFLMSGFALMSLGAILLIDSDRILLSRLIGTNDVYPEQPPFYYAALAVVAIGFLIAIAGLLGCWASCLHNCCITASYVGLLMLLVMGKCGLVVLVVFCPDRLGVDLQPGRLLRALQRTYALPSHEQFTAALDLAQTAFSCCGINGSNNYGSSWWRLQESSRRDFVVPLSCCILNNAHEQDGFLNPEPRNLSLCQALNPAEHQQARHSPGCMPTIEAWLQEQVLILLAVVLCVILVELCALLSTVLACSQLKRGNGPSRRPCPGMSKPRGPSSSASCFTSTQTLSPFCNSTAEHEQQDYAALSCEGAANRLAIIPGGTFAGKS
ncbi:CD151 antigen-like [Copidosoma floridanum]|uniref:CD151 antigen-like n=1 Tax=Copidosoma floridanum TaxID=29053 RepID=UPI0006C980C6|nr:CD151 antigen-like [Copidosoma floridanum]